MLRKSSSGALRKVKNFRDRVLSSGSCNKPLEFDDKRDRVMALKQELEDAKPVVAAWIRILAQVKTAGLLMQTSARLTDSWSVEFGSNMVRSMANADMLEALNAAMRSLNKKLGLLADLERKMHTLDRTGAARDRLEQRKLESMQKLIKKGKAFSTDEIKYQREYDKACWEFEEIYCELMAEFDFFLIESKKHGLAGTELYFVRQLAHHMMPSCEMAGTQDTGPTKALTPDSIEHMKSYLDALLVRKAGYVTHKRGDLLHEKLEAKGLVTSDLLAANRFGSCPATSSPKALKLLGAAEAALQRRQSSSGSSSSATSVATLQMPRDADSTCSTSEEGSHVEGAETEEEKPLAVAADVPAPGTPPDPDMPELSENPAGPASTKHELPGIVSVSVRPPVSSPVSAGATEEQARQVEEEDDEVNPRGGGRLSSEVRARMSAGFKVKEENGWLEFVGRETGESYWVHPGDNIIKEDGPPEGFTAIGT
ncbi:Uncharacterized protein SCF082_LOCUS11565 [Durusdinium trenchii]|uniref:BAR domain-containing protein n=1 Tax=Durusdinium trenchii TaxID=1381693 RepID=A0ABP0JDV9_9DINO